MCTCDGGLQLKLSCLENTPLSLYLEEADLKLVAATFQKVSTTVGSVLPTSPLYYLLKGKVEIRAANAQEGDKPITIRHDGAFFSAKAGLVKKAKKAGNEKSVIRRASAAIMGGAGDTGALTEGSVGRPGGSSEDKATVPVVTEAGSVLLVNEQKMEKLVAASPNIKSIIQAMGSNNLEGRLQAVPFIQRAKLQPAQLSALAELGTYHACKPEEDIFCQGDDASSPSSAFYICLHGSVDLWTSATAYRTSGVVRSSLMPDGKGADKPELSTQSVGGKKSLEADAVKSGTIAAGSFFGELALVIDGVRTATVRTAEKSLFLVITREHFEAFLRVAPALKESIELEAKERLLSVYRNLKVPFFCELKDEKIVEAAMHATLERHSQGDVIIKEGAMGRTFFVVVMGQVRVDIADAPTDNPKILGNGHYFGEFSVLAERPALATCSVASTKCTLLALERDSFIQLFADDEELVAYMNIKLLQSDCSLRDVLTYKKSRELFATYLKTEFAEEALWFFDEVTPFQQLPEAELQATAERFVKEYISDTAEKQVNIPDKMRKAVMKEVKDKNVTNKTFDKAREECYTLMARDNFRRFILVDSFKALIEELGGYDVGSFDGTDHLDAMSHLHGREVVDKDKLTA